VKLTEEGKEVRDEGIGNIETVILPEMLCESRVLSVLVVIDDPKLVRVVEFREIQGLQTRPDSSAEFETEISREEIYELEEPEEQRFERRPPARGFP